MAWASADGAKPYHLHRHRHWHKIVMPVVTGLVVVGVWKVMGIAATLSSNRRVLKSLPLLLLGTTVGL